MMTPEELQARRHFIGGSDVPAILGFDPYRSPRDVWLEKTGRVELVSEPSDPATFGSMVEPVLIDWAARVLGVEIKRGVIAHHPEHPHMRAQLDGWIEGQQAVVESKAYGLWNPRWSGDDWGTDGTDMVPWSVMAQVNFGMACATATAGHVVGLLGRGMGVRVYYLPRNESLVQEIERACDEFWWGNVVADVPPDAPPGLDTLKRVIREPESQVEIDHDWPDKWASLKDQERLIASAVSEAKRDILTEMGEAEIGFTPFGSFSYRANVKGVRTLRYHGPAGEGNGG